MRVHISLNVSDIDRSIDFYSSLLGEAPSKKKQGYANFRLNKPPIHLALQQSTQPIGAGVSHLGIELEDRDVLEQTRQRFETSGINFRVEDKARCCYARADKLWATDPDGYSWEFWLRTGEFESMGETRMEPDKAEAGSPCCSA